MQIDYLLGVSSYDKVYLELRVIAYLSWWSSYTLPGLLSLSFGGGNLVDATLIICAGFSMTAKMSKKFFQVKMGI